MHARRTGLGILTVIPLLIAHVKLLVDHFVPELSGALALNDTQCGLFITKGS